MYWKNTCYIYVWYNIFIYIFTFSSYEKILVLCDNNFKNFHKITTFWDSLSENKWFLRLCLSAVVAVGICKHDNFRKNYRIRMRFGKLLEADKKRVYLLTSHSLPTILLLYIENIFQKIWNSIFPVKIYQI